MMNYYVYYRVEPGRLEELARAVQEIFAAVSKDVGVHGRWMRRRDDPSTFMEVYEQVPDAARFEALLAREAERCAFQRLLAAGTSRHLECFVSALA